MFQQNAVDYDLEANIASLSINDDEAPSKVLQTEGATGQGSSPGTPGTPVDEVFESVGGKSSPQRSEETKVRSQSFLEHMDSCDEGDRQQMEEGELVYTQVICV